MALSGYIHASYRWISEPQNYTLVGRNNGFQLPQVACGRRAVAAAAGGRVSVEAASEDRLSQSFPGGQMTTRLRDAYITWAPLRELRVTVGQQVTPWDLESMRRMPSCRLCRAASLSKACSRRRASRRVAWAPIATWASRCTPASFRSAAGRRSVTRYLPAMATARTSSQRQQHPGAVRPCRVCLLGPGRAAAGSGAADVFDQR